MSLTINNESFTIINNGKSFEILKDNASLDRSPTRVYMNGFWWDLEKATADGYASLDDLYNTLRDKIDHRYASGGGGGIESIVEGTNITVDDTDPLNPIISVQDITLSGEVTGSTSLSAIDKTAITNKTTETIVGTDYVLFGDTSDGDNLKKGLVSDIVALSGGGTPAGSDTQIQYNNAGAFGASSDLIWDNTNKLFIAGDFGGTANHTYIVSDDTSSLVVANGLKNTVPASTTTPVFTVSGLDDLTTSGTFTGIIGISYTVTVSANGTPDSFDWTDTDGGSGTNVPMSTSPTLLSNGIEVVFGADTGHTLTDNWTFDGVPAVTTYGQMLKLDGASQAYRFGDVEDVSDKAKLEITGGSKPKYTNYFDNNGNYVVKGSLNSQDYLSINGSNEEALFTLDTFRIKNTSNQEYFTADKATGSYIFGNTDSGGTNLNLYDSTGSAYLTTVNQIGLGINDGGINVLGGSSDSRTYITGKIGSTGFSTGLDLRFKENKYSIGDIGTINNGTYLEINDNAKNVNNYTDQFYIRNSASTSNVTFSTDTATLSATIGDVNGTGNNTKITIDDLNEQITISNLPAYDDDTAAGVGGLTTGMVYMTTGSGSAPLNAAGILMIKQ